MNNMKGYMTGINFGGWISQYFAYDANMTDFKHHFDTFIIEEDVKIVAESGFDHVRVPVDYPALKELNGFFYLDSVIDWAKKHGLNVIIDLHSAPGFVFDKEENSLLDSPGHQDELADMWKKITARYKDEGQNIRFELLNEIKDSTPDKWNALAERLIRDIRTIDTEHFIVVGGINYNSIDALEGLKRFDDDKIMYTFHMYKPLPFTHQTASWVPCLMDMKVQIPYPCPMDEYNTAIKENTKNITMQFSPPEIVAGRDIDKEYLRELFAPAIDFIKETGLPLYNGEYGVIDVVDMQSRVNYVNDIAELCIEYGIGRAMWNYKELNFRFVDKDRNIVSDNLVKAAAKR